MKYIRLVMIVLLCIYSYGMLAQEKYLYKYHRSSLYSVLVYNQEDEFSEEIKEAFKSIPIPDRFNDHDLKIKIFPSPILRELTKKELEGSYREAIEKMLTKNGIAYRLIEKWFNRDKNIGTFNMDLVAERGYYDASVLDVREAMSSFRGRNLLEDASEELINHTYVVVNDIRYADKEKTKAFINIGLSIPRILLLDFANISGRVVRDMAGFRVFVTSYLFRLDWNQENSNYFYNSLWMDSLSLDTERKAKWSEAKSLFHLKYIGCTTVFSGETKLNGLKHENDVFLKVCTRAIDKSISDLQKNFDEFKVFTPLISTEPLCAYIGLKEGVDEDSRYEVLERTIDSNGLTKYERVGEIKPVKGQIWDNRFMAEFDKEDGFDLKYTTFKKVSGKDFFPGMLIREIR